MNTQTHGEYHERLARIEYRARAAFWGSVAELHDRAPYLGEPLAATLAAFTPATPAAERWTAIDGLLDAGAKFAGDRVAEVTVLARAALDMMSIADLAASKVPTEERLLVAMETFVAEAGRLVATLDDDRAEFYGARLQKLSDAIRAAF